MPGGVCAGDPPWRRRRRWRRQGILLEQDGIFSNGVYESDPAFLALVTAETQYQARRLASHPSLFMWSGSNELAPWGQTPGNWWSVLFERTFFPALTAIDASRPVWAACPASQWLSGVDNTTTLPDGTPFRIAGAKEPPVAEAHAYVGRPCPPTAPRSCRGGAARHGCVRLAACPTGVAKPHTVKENTSRPHFPPTPWMACRSHAW